jgi:predicted transcriptional regulator
METPTKPRPSVKHQPRQIRQASAGTRQRRRFDVSARTRDEQKICCGLCGRWYRALPPHLHAAHDWTADDYRVALGLNAQRALQAPAVSGAQAARLKRRLRMDQRLQVGMRRGLALAHSGQLNELGRQVGARRGPGAA